MSKRSGTLREFTAAFRAIADGAGKQALLDPRSRFVYGLALIALVAEGAAMAAFGFTLEHRGFRLSLFWTLWLLFSALLARKYGFGRAAICLEAVFLPILLGSLIAAGTFMTTILSEGFSDDWLIHADRMLGFDWVALWRMYQASPTLLMSSAWIYDTFLMQLGIVPMLLIAFGRSDRLWVFLTAWAMAGLATALIHPFFPTEGPYFRYGAMHEIMPHYTPNASGSYMWDLGAKIEAIRGGSLREMTSAMSGLVSVPSFHAISAVLFAWATFALRWLRLPFVLLNVAMWLSSLISGNHYLIDLIAGTAVAIAAIFVANRIVLRSGAPRPALADGGS